MRSLRTKVVHGVVALMGGGSVGGGFFAPVVLKMMHQKWP